MAVLNRDDFLKIIKEHVGEDTSDGAIKFIEDLTDTYDDLSKSKGEDWKTKYEAEVKAREANDAEWRKKYTDRFFNNDTSEEKVDNSDTPGPTDIKISDLFKDK